MFHAVYSSYSESMTWPGLLWNNLFFAISLSTMLVALVFEGVEESKLRRVHPDKFPPNASTMMMDFITKNLPCS